MKPNCKSGGIYSRKNQFDFFYGANFPNGKEHIYVPDNMTNAQLQKWYARFAKELREKSVLMRPGSKICVV